MRYGARYASGSGARRHTDLPAALTFAALGIPRSREGWGCSVRACGVVICRRGSGSARLQIGFGTRQRERTPGLVLSQVGASWCFAHGIAPSWETMSRDGGRSPLTDDAVCQWIRRLFFAIIGLGMQGRGRGAGEAREGPRHSRASSHRVWRRDARKGRVRAV